jgi:hypothetical protein
MNSEMMNGTRKSEKEKLFLFDQLGLISIACAASSRSPHSHTFATPRRNGNFHSALLCLQPSFDMNANLGSFLFLL